MIIINANNIFKNYGTREVLRGADFVVNQGDRVGLVGVNGCGKTTLLDIICGKISQDEGTLHIRRDISMGYLEQIVDVSNVSIYEFCEQNFDHILHLEQKMKAMEQEMSIACTDNLLENYGTLREEFEKLEGYAVQSKIKGIINGLGLDQERSMATLSGGERARVALANLLLKEPEILVLDEPTNHLDLSAISWLEKYLVDYRGSIIIVSHDRYFLDKLCTKITHMEHGKTKTYKGNYTQAMTQRKTEYEIALRQYENQQKEIKRQEAIIREYYNRATEKQIKKAKSRQKMLDKVEVMEKPELFKRYFTMRLQTGYTGGNEVLHMEDVQKSFHDTKKAILQHVNLNVQKGDKIGLIGENGAGKSTLIKIIRKEIPKDGGILRLGSGITLGYFAQNQETLTSEKTILNEIHDQNPQMTISEIRGLLGAFMFKADLDRLVSNLSGGERSRLALLKLMLSPANFLLLDEPTNHLDIDSKEILEEALKDYHGSFIAISHDRYFLNSVCNRISQLKEGVLSSYMGNYDDFAAEMDKIQSLKTENDHDFNGGSSSSSMTKTKAKELAKKEREERNLLKKQKIQKRETEKQIEKNEDQIARWEQELCKPEVFEDYVKAQKLSDSIQKLKEETEELYNQLLE